MNDTYENMPRVKNFMRFKDFAVCDMEICGNSVSFSEDVNPDDDYTINGVAIPELSFNVLDANKSLENEIEIESDIYWDCGIEDSKKNGEITGFPISNGLFVKTNYYGSLKSKAFTISGNVLTMWDYDTKEKLSAFIVPDESIKTVQSLVWLEEHWDRNPSPRNIEYVDGLYLLSSEYPYYYRIVVDIYNNTMAEGEKVTLSDFQIEQIKNISNRRMSICIQGTGLGSLRCKVCEEFIPKVENNSYVSIISNYYELWGMGNYVLKKATRSKELVLSLNCEGELCKADVLIDDIIKNANSGIISTSRNLISAISEKIGVSILDDDVLDFSVSKRFEGTGITALEVLRWMAEANGMFIKSSEFGGLSFEKHYRRNLSTVLNRSRYKELTFSDYTIMPVDLVQSVSMEDDIGAKYPTDVTNASNVYLIENNPFLYTETEKEVSDRLSAIYEHMRESTIRPFKCVTRFNPSLHAGSVITIQGRNHVEFEGYIMRRTLKNGMDTYEAIGKKTRDVGYSSQSRNFRSIYGKYMTLKADLDEFKVSIGNRMTNAETTIKAQAGTLEILVKSDAGHEARIKAAEGQINFLTTHGVIFSDLTTDYTTIQPPLTAEQIAARKAKTAIYGGLIQTNTIEARSIKAGTITAEKLNVTSLEESHAFDNFLRKNGNGQVTPTISVIKFTNGAMLSGTGSGSNQTLNVDATVIKSNDKRILTVDDL